MFRVITLLTLPFVFVPAWSDPLPSPLPETIYFSTDWCPEKEELTELSKHLKLTMNRCCILKATLLPLTISNSELLSPWSHRIYVKNSDPTFPCVGLMATEENNEELKAARLKQIEADRMRYDGEKAKNTLKAMTKNEFCETYGMALRGGEVYDIGALPDIVKLVKKEATRRTLRFDDSLVRKEQIRMGISECQLYASWGMPEDQNRSVGSWGVHVQHVFGLSRYVYTENGKVTSWQN